MINFYKEYHLDQDEFEFRADDISHAANFHRTDTGGYCENGTHITTIEDQIRENTEEKKTTLNSHEQYVFDFARNHSLSIEEARNQPMVKAHLDFFNATGR
jgi:hypothetical protein